MKNAYNKVAIIVMKTKMKPEFIKSVNKSYLK